MMKLAKLHRKPGSTARYERVSVPPRFDDDYLPDLSRSDVEQITRRAHDAAVNYFADSDERYLWHSSR